MALALAALCVGLSACADRHQLQWLANGDGTFVLVLDYVHKPVGTQDVIVSLEETRGIASEVAVFRNIQSFTATWLGPQDINICQVGTVQDYKTHVVINARAGKQDFHIQYSCP
jgi:hypothetical protein